MKYGYVIFYNGKVLRKRFMDYNAAVARLQRTLENDGQVLRDGTIINPTFCDDLSTRVFGILLVPYKVDFKESGCWAKTLK